MNNFVQLIIDKYYDICQENTFEKGQVIFNEGNPCNELTIVLNGEILISTITYNEKEETINVIKDCDIFGDILCNATNNIYLGDVICQKKTKVLILSKEKLMKLLLSDSVLLDSYLTLISDKTLDIKLQAKLFSHKRIDDRIMYYLSLKAINNLVFIDSVTELAKALSLPRPSVSRTLSDLESSGLITRDNKFIYIKKTIDQ